MSSVCWPRRQSTRGTDGLTVKLPESGVEMDRIAGGVSYRPTSCPCLRQEQAQFCKCAFLRFGKFTGWLLERPKHNAATPNWPVVYKPAAVSRRWNNCAVACSSGFLRPVLRVELDDGDPVRSKCGFLLVLDLDGYFICGHQHTGAAEACIGEDEMAADAGA